MKKVEIIPAILPKDFSELEEKISFINGLVKTVQIDICDGQFVPNATWPYRKKDDSFEKIVKEDMGLPGWDKLNYEIDLMVNNPEQIIEDWISAGANRIILHTEAKGNISEALEKIQDRLEVGLALNIETPIKIIEPYKDRIQSIQCMGIDQIGFQGQDFDEKVIEKIKEIKKTYPEILLSIDGGVSLENVRELISAGADRLIVGSAIFDSDNIFEAIKKFSTEARSSML